MIFLVPAPNHTVRAAQVCPERSRRGYPAGQSLAARFNRRSWIRAVLAVLAILCPAPLLSGSDCIPIHEAAQHIGETKCVLGNVVRVKAGAKGVHFLDVCEDQLSCPFTVVVFSHDLRDVGDVRHLSRLTMEIRSALKLYDGRSETILNRISQIKGGAAMIPPLPKTYDVENHGHFSAGRLRPTKKPKKTKAKPNPTVTYGNDGEGSDRQE